ncbi:Hsp20/alpha crystallin family protein [Streptomyces sp. R33]|uniref:Hsp20/alpha crystallin family protein n=1 Tax=Streptomyces sp. R33 TaxID=3238629 RepID=A0AB39YET2_9ACTN|nr:heat-shock protein Hsp20 [Streptomyces sp. NRRL S-444]
MMLMRTDPFRELDRLTQQVLGTAARPAAMSMDAFREGDAFVVELDLPGVDPESIDLDVEQNVLTIKAERRTTASAENSDVLIAERPSGTFTRQLFLGETLDADHIEASYEAGVLRLSIPVAEEEKPRKIQVRAADGSRKEINA